MFTVEVKTSQAWVLKSKDLKPERWTIVGRVESQVEAEKDISWLTLGFEDISFPRKFQVGFRIRDKNGVVWEQEKTY